MARINPKAKLICIDGQSNAVGTDTLFTDLTAEQLSAFPTNKVLIWVSGAFVPVDANTAITLGDEFGPELGMAYQLQKNSPDEVIFISKYCVGSTSFQGGDWNPGDDTYEAAVAQHNAAIAEIKARGYYPELIVDWVQGEGDGMAEAASLAYQAAQAAMYAGLDADLDAPIVKIIDWKLSVNQTTVTYRANVNAGKVTNAAADSRIVLFETNGFCSASGDGVHYNSASMWEMGIRMGRIVMGETIRTWGEQLGYDAVVDPTCGQGDYILPSRAFVAVGASKKYLIRGSFTETTSPVIPASSYINWDNVTITLTDLYLDFSNYSGAYGTGKLHLTGTGNTTQGRLLYVGSGNNIQYGDCKITLNPTRVGGGTDGNLNAAILGTGENLHFDVSIPQPVTVSANIEALMVWVYAKKLSSIRVAIDEVTGSGTLSYFRGVQLTSCVDAKITFAVHSVTGPGAAVHGVYVENNSDGVVMEGVIQDCSGNISDSGVGTIKTNLKY